MNNFSHIVLSVLILLQSSGAFPHSGLGVGGSRARRSTPCKASEYLHNNICCLNCPAGTHVTSHCTTAGEKGGCEECNYGTFMEHASGLNQCFKCTRCRSDQEIVKQCTSTEDTECQCKPGRFCAPDQACEVCKKCSRCKEDEETVRNCTSTSNTECKKIQPSTPSASGNPALIVPPVLIVAGIIFVIISLCYWRKCKARDSQRNDGTKGQHYTTVERRNGDTQRPSFSMWRLVRAKPSSAGVKDEHEGLCHSLGSSASNSQHSLTRPPSPTFPAPAPQASPRAVRWPDRREDEPFPKLVPVNGEVSLRKCFEYLENLEVDYHKRFFRHLGITDNVIKSKEHLPYEDKIHDLLGVWVEKEGRHADLNDLLRVLLDLNQRRTAELVKESAIRNGHYVCKPECEVV